MSKKSRADGPVSRWFGNDFCKFIAYFDVDIIDRHQTTKDGLTLEWVKYWSTWLIRFLNLIFENLSM